VAGDLTLLFMSALLTIGEFSRATHLSVKTLRHYDDIDLLRPAHIDPSSGYRRYANAQVPTAQVIRRFRHLDMPLEEIRAVLNASDPLERDRAIISHLERMEAALEHTQATVQSLRALLEGRQAQADLPVEYRYAPPTRAIAIAEDVEWGQTEEWLSEALSALRSALPSEDRRTGPDAALYSSEFFEAHVGEVVAYIPVTAEMPTAGRITMRDIPAADLAVIVHHGPFSELDQAYGALGTVVTEQAIGTDGPIREHYLDTDTDTDTADDTTTEVCWPIHRRRES
jgi:DNA-binding transcriptional MerR regulator